MRSISEQAETILATVLLQDAQLREAGVPAIGRFAACKPGLEALLSQYQDEMLEAQRQTGVALAQALNMAAGR